MLLEISDDDEVDSINIVCYNDGNDDRGHHDGIRVRGVKRFRGVVVRVVVVVSCLRGCWSIGIVGCVASSSDCRSGRGGPERNQ